MTQPGPPSRLVSALADPERLRVFSRIVLVGEHGVAESELAVATPGVGKHLTRLQAARLVSRSADGVLTARPDAFSDALRPQGEAASVEGDEPDPAVRNLFSAGGRLTALPVRKELRRALLEHLTARMFELGAVYSEGEVNIAIKQYWADFPALRRYLVEAGLLVRSADGSRYQVAA